MRKFIIISAAILGLIFSTNLIFFKFLNYLSDLERKEQITIIQSNGPKLCAWAEQHIFSRQFKREDIKFSGSGILGYRIPEYIVKWPEFVEFESNLRVIKIIGDSFEKPDVVLLGKNSRFGIILVKPSESPDILSDPSIFKVYDNIYVYSRM